MRNQFIKLYEKFPFIDSVISLILGAGISYFFQNVFDVWKLNGTGKEKIIATASFIVSIIITLAYYKFFYSKNKRATALEKEREKNEIQRLKNEREMIRSLYKQGAKAMEKDELSIIEKVEIIKQISLVSKDNKREI